MYWKRTLPQAAFCTLICILSFLPLSDVEGAGTQITDDGFDQLYARFSPDGASIAYSSMEDGGGLLDIWIMDEDGSNRVQLTDDPCDQYVCDWSPDGNMIAYFSDEDGGGFLDIWTMKSDGSAHIQLTNDDFDQTATSLSPDGAKIVYSSAEDGGGFLDIYVVDIISTHQLTWENSDQIHPYYHPYHSWIVYSSKEDGGSYYDIWLMNEDGTGHQQLTFENADQLSPRFTKDGNRIIYYSDEDGGNFHDLWIMDAWGGGHVQITDQNSHQTMPDFNHDGMKIAYHSNEDGGAFSDIWVIENQPPSISASADPITGTVPLSVTFTGIANDPDGRIVSYHWNFDDGFFSSVQNPVHKFESTGTFHVHFSATDSYGTTVTTGPVNITVLDPEGAEKTWSLQRVDSNEFDMYIPTKEIWEDKVNAFGIAERKVITDQAYFNGENDLIWPGKHNYIARATAFVYVETQFLLTGNLLGDDGHSLYIDDEFIVGVPDTSSPAFDVPMKKGWRKIELIWQEVNGGHGVGLGTRLTSESNVGSMNVLYALIEADPSSGYIPLDVTFNSNINDPDGEIVSYLWDFGDGTNTTKESPGYTYAVEGEFVVTLTVTDREGARATATTIISVTEPPNEPPTASASATPLTGNAPLSVSFRGSGSDTDGSITSYRWTFGDGDASSERNTAHTYRKNGNYKAVFTVTDDDGAMETVTITITVTRSPNKSPVASITASLRSGTAPLLIFFNGTGSDSDGKIALYRWNFGDGIVTTGQNTRHTFVEEGEYRVSLTVTDDDGATGRANITISVKAGKEIDGEDEGPLPATYQWDQAEESKEEDNPYWKLDYTNGVLISIIVVLLVIVYVMFSWKKIRK